METSKITCTRRLCFEAGHRVLGHESKCAHFHGHSYKVWLEAHNAIDDVGRVVDFSVLKSTVGTWIDENWDHAMILNAHDLSGLSLFSELEIGPKQQRLFVLPYNPTAENMAKYLLEKVCPELLNPLGVRVISVVVQETENCTATATLS